MPIRRANRSVREAPENTSKDVRSERWRVTGWGPMRHAIRRERVTRRVHDRGDINVREALGPCHGGKDTESMPSLVRRVEVSSQAPIEWAEAGQRDAVERPDLRIVEVAIRLRRHWPGHIRLGLGSKALAWAC